ncbi:MAG: S26 family signal peptidase, partial [Pirellulaceae bacterium]
AALSIDQGSRPFVDLEGNAVDRPTGQTSLRKPGSYRLRFANVDDQVLLWVNRRLVPFEGPTTYQAPTHVAPQWSPDDPGDLRPIGIGSRGTDLHAKRLRVFRDVYYLAVHTGNESEYSGRYAFASSAFEIQEIMADPTQWNHTDLFASRMAAEFHLEEDQFFPMGDNSPQSKDARLWSTIYGPPPYVDRQLLIGKALLIYWPHAWRTPLFSLPILPNFGRMRFIR